VDRAKELIKVKGNQVAPAELEAVLLEHEDVADAAVIGVPMRGDERPRAYVVLKEGRKITPKEIKKWTDTRVAMHKRLEGGVVLVDTVPKNPVSFASLSLPPLELSFLAIHYPYA
jgi:acyl-CoA synthetase (AMP-forming)/AMP-acid ligase II